MIMLRSYKFFVLLICSINLPVICNGQVQDKKATVFTLDDNSTKYKVDPSEINKIKAMDVQAIKEKIESMRDKVLDSKSKLMEVSKDGLNAAPMSYLSISHINKMSSRFNIMSLKYILDGKSVFSVFDVNQDKQDAPILSSFINPGHHELVVEAVVSGSASGVFDYLKDYKIKVQDRYSFVIPDNKKVLISGISYEKGGIFTSFKERPAIKFETQLQNKMPERIEQ